MINDRRSAKLVRVDAAAQIAREEYLLDEGDPQAGCCLSEGICLIGRAETCNIVIQSGDQLISRVHARIERDSDPRYQHRYILHDEESANGTFINEVAVPPNEPHRLMDRDCIGLGSPTPLLRFVDLDPTKKRIGGGRLRYDERSREFFLDHQKVFVSGRTFDLLYLLYTNMNILCLRSDCARAIWKSQYSSRDEGGKLDDVVRELRKRLDEAAVSEADRPSRHILSRRGEGYILQSF